jgi:hypothetical protein
MHYQLNSVFQPITKALLVSLFVLSMTGCASIVSGTKQPVSVTTHPIAGATCQLENNKGTWYIPATPGSVVVHRSYHDLKISCKKKGYKQAIKNVTSSTKGMAFGNVLFGGFVGAGVDVANGAAYDYPNEIHLPLNKKALG